MDSLTVATRGGDLALAQTRMVISEIEKTCPGLHVEIKKITTKGDNDRRTALWDLKDSGFFTAQVEDTLLAKEADFAVHSFKDMPTFQSKGLTVAAVFQRRFVEDCLIANGSISSIEQIKTSARVGTSSLRRAVQMKRLRNDLQILPIRGNVPTRLRHLDEGKFDAIILARAGLERLGLSKRISICFDPDIFVPAAAQGALAIQAREDNMVVNEKLKMIDDKTARITACAERRVLDVMQCGCHAPVGVFARIENNDIRISAFISDAQGNDYIKKEIEGSVEQTDDLAEKLAIELLDSGGKDILSKLKNDRN